MPPTRSFARRLLSIAVVVSLMGGIVVAGLKHQDILDWWMLRSYQPPATIAALAKETTMTSYGRKLFYVNHPELDGRDTFNSKCPEDEQTIVLGCYVSHHGIYLFDVTDTRLNGVEQVTAAHEMLHAAYERLSNQQRQHINRLVTDTYKSLHDKHLTDVIGQYQRTEPGQIPNELHSILGTEIGNLPAELEQYYRQYFSNRSAIVAYAQKYRTEFTQRQDQVAADDVQLTKLKKQIDTTQANLSDSYASLQQQQAQLNQLATQHKYAEYNAQARTFNQQVAAYNAQVASLQQLISQYNQLVRERNVLALEVNNLAQAIDSHPKSFQ